MNTTTATKFHQADLSIIAIASHGLDGRARELKRIAAIALQVCNGEITIETAQGIARGVEPCNGTAELAAAAMRIEHANTSLDRIMIQFTDADGVDFDWPDLI